MPAIETHGLTKDYGARRGAPVATAGRWKEPALAEVRDQEVQVVTHHDSLPHIHLKETEVPGQYNVGLWIEGIYLPGESKAATDGGHGGHGEHGAPASTQGGERFIRVLNSSLGLAPRK